MAIERNEIRRENTKTRNAFGSACSDALVASALGLTLVLVAQTFRPAVTIAQSPTSGIGRAPNRRGVEGDRHRGHARRQGPRPWQRHRRGRQVGLHASLRDVPRSDRQRRAAGHARRRPRIARNVDSRRRPSAATGRMRRRCGITSAARCRSIIPERSPPTRCTPPRRTCSS